jgi:hypothetical protein
MQYLIIAVGKTAQGTSQVVRRLSPNSFALEYASLALVDRERTHGE